MHIIQSQFNIGNKVKFKIGQQVKDEDGDAGFITQITIRANYVSYLVETDVLEYEAFESDLTLVEDE